MIEVTPELVKVLPIIENALMHCADEVKLQFQMLQFQLLRDYARQS